MNPMAATNIISSMPTIVMLTISNRVLAIRRSIGLIIVVLKERSIRVRRVNNPPSHVVKK